MSASVQMMMQRLQAYARDVMEYENPEWQGEAMQRIPADLLQERAAKAIAEQSGDASKRLSLRDELLKQLLHWFKFEFFKWTNAPACEQCQGATTMIGGTAPNAEEARWRAGIVELYRCNSCGRVTRYPRYNHPVKLLSTRHGRCGEWANCFTLCCRAMRFDARAVHDWSDHVWSECYSEQQRRWIHCDPCEDAMDRPELYESGWGKKLSYVIAFSVDEAVDVTRRYTTRYHEVKTRRTQCPEAVLQVLVSQLHLQRWHRATPERRRVLLERGLAEQQELQGAVSVSHNLLVGELAGRTTGSAEWRRARGEMGDESRTQAAIRAQEENKQQIQQLQQPQHSAEADKKEEKEEAASAPVSPPAAAPALSTTATTTSPSSSSSATQLPSRPVAVDSVEEGKRQVKLLFSRYHSQLTEGCGRSDCRNDNCRSSASFVPGTDSSAAGIAKRCLELTTRYKAAKLCETVNADERNSTSSR